jgi:hypothetical protein
MLNSLLKHLNMLEAQGQAASAHQIESSNLGIGLCAKIPASSTTDGAVPQLCSAACRKDGRQER